MNYRSQAARLRAVGFRVSLGKRGVVSTPALRSAVARLSKRLDLLERENVYVPANSKGIRMQGTRGKRTSTGVFVPVPYGVAQRNFKARIDAKGDLRISYGERREIVRPIPATLMLEETAPVTIGKMVKKYGKNAFGIVTVKGWDGKREFDLNLAPLYFSRLRAQFRGNERQFRDVFRLKIVIPT